MHMRIKKGIIFDIKKYAVHDGPGIRTTVFFKGCPLRCAWCHNPESWKMEPEPMFRYSRCIQCGKCKSVCPENAVTIGKALPITNTEICVCCGECTLTCPVMAREIAGKKVKIEDIMSEIRKDIIFYDESGGGVTFSGGEPLMQPEFLMGLLEECKKEEIHTTIDTCGYAKRDVVEKIIPLADLFLCDIKHMDSVKHKEYTGVGNEQILENLKLIIKYNKKMIIRVPVIPGFNDNIEAIEDIARFAKQELGVVEVDLLAYNSGGVSKSQRLSSETKIIQESRPTVDKMEMLSDVIREYGLEIIKGG